MKSIMQREVECYFCGRTDSLERHHALHGTANRRLAEQDGLTVYLCADCHRALHDKGIGDKSLQKAAESIWIRAYGTREEFIQRYGKSYE